ncbi:uncharacterized protein EV420DRAFT_1695661 [Desarmillaria tabescens]|uniref:Uncharacterized protein n=1 Tax=Armillaria tabescens TaxID=1929756 RepID=A0AA39N1Y4_ARMTA|nr:uncharacterized protein EV420DRAFT_1695661 [Desarmillaria tabescens]KAK0454205.1 hypothetical protein EV420DRAFT_1695661 [Desarmillaria tabescens]
MARIYLDSANETVISQQPGLVSEKKLEWRLAPANTKVLRLLSSDSAMPVAHRRTHYGQDNKPNLVLRDGYKTSTSRAGGTLPVSGSLSASVFLAAISYTVLVTLPHGPSLMLVISTTAGTKQLSGKSTFTTSTGVEQPTTSDHLCLRRLRNYSSWRSLEAHSYQLSLKPYWSKLLRDVIRTILSKRHGFVQNLLQRGLNVSLAIPWPGGRRQSTPIRISITTSALQMRRSKTLLAIIWDRYIWTRGNFGV